MYSGCKQDGGDARASVVPEKGLGDGYPVRRGAQLLDERGLGDRLRLCSLRQLVSDKLSAAACNHRLLLDERSLVHRHAWPPPPIDVSLAW